MKKQVNKAISIYKSGASLEIAIAALLQMMRGKDIIRQAEAIAVLLKEYHRQGYEMKEVLDVSEFYKDEDVTGAVD